MAVSSTDEETPMRKEDAVKYIKKYLGVMFGQDVGNSVNADSVSTIGADGSEMGAEELKKWEEQ